MTCPDVNGLAATIEPYPRPGLPVNAASMQKALAVGHRYAQGKVAVTFAA